MRPNAPTLAVLLAVALLGIALAFAGPSARTVEERWLALGLPEPRVEFIGDDLDALNEIFAGAPQDHIGIIITLPETPEALAARLCPAR